MAPKRKAPAQDPEAPRSRRAAADPAAEAPAAKRKRIEKEFLVHRVSGQCFTFGTNPFGALGLGEDVLEKRRPAEAVDVDGKRLVQVACGGMHTVALAEDGTVYTWGVNDEGALGRPTSGTAWEETEDSEKEDSCVPGRARVPGEVFIVQVVAGDGFTFGLADDGAIWGWGSFKDDSSGKQGFPGTAGQLQRLPVRVREPSSVRDRVRKLAAGARHIVALTRKGEVLTWGMGGQGQLGRVPQYDQTNYPPLQQLLVPTSVPGKALAAALGGGELADVAAGTYTSYAITRRGAVAGWGLNNAGQLAQPEGQFFWEPVAAPAPLNAGVASVAGGELHTLALKRNGVVLSFGDVKYGMLGRSDVDTAGAAAYHPEPGPVSTSDGLDAEHVTALAAATNVSGCVTKGGNIYLWGSNVNLQLAKGPDDSDSLEPKRMQRSKTFGKRHIVGLSFGGQHGALLALDKEGGDGAGAAAAAAAPAAPAAADGPGAGGAAAP